MVSGESKNGQLMLLLVAIGSGDAEKALRLLEDSPELASEALMSGATRSSPAEHYFSEIAHYAYAGDTGLHLASAGYQLEIVKKLLDLKANVRAKNRRGAEPLHYATDGNPAFNNWNPTVQRAIIKLLLENGADPNSPDKNGVTPLHRAVRTRCTAAVYELLENGADPKIRNRSGSTPLHLAVQNTGRGGSGTEEARAQQRQIISLLLKHGARPTDKNSAGKSVADSATADWIHNLLREK